MKHAKRHVSPSLDPLVGRAGRTKDAEERTRWVVAVALDGEDTATEYPAGDDREGAYRQARILCDVLKKRGTRAVVAVAEVEERRITVMELRTCSPNAPVSDGGRTAL